MAYIYYGGMGIPGLDGDEEPNEEEVDDRRQLAVLRTRPLAAHRHAEHAQCGLHRRALCVQSCG